MATVGYAKTRIPGGHDAPVGPGALAELATDIDPHLLHHVVDVAQRDAQFSDAPVHTAVTADNGTLWLKTSDTENRWATVFEPDPEWRPISLLSGYTADAYTPQVRRKGNQVWLRGRVAKTDGSVIANGGTAIAKVPDDCIPQIEIGAYAATSSLAGDVVIGAGKLEILDVNTATALGPPGSILWWSQDGPGTPWVNVSGSYWID